MKSLLYKLTKIKFISLLILLCTSCNSTPEIGAIYCDIDKDKVSGRAGWKLTVIDVVNGEVFSEFKHLYFEKMRDEMALQGGSLSKHRDSIEKFNLRIKRQKLSKNKCRELTDEVAFFRKMQYLSVKKDPRLINLLDRFKDKEISSNEFRERVLEL